MFKKINFIQDPYQHLKIYKDTILYYLVWLIVLYGWLRISQSIGKSLKIELFGLTERE